MSAQARLTIYRGEELLAEHDLMRPVVGLGRHPENDIVLDDRTLSRFHARIERRQDRFVVVDLGAQNGVNLNGARIDRESELHAGDKIVLGRYTAIFDAAPAAAVDVVDDAESSFIATSRRPQASPTARTGKAGRNGVPVQPAQTKGRALDLDLDLDLPGSLHENVKRRLAHHTSDLDVEPSSLPPLSAAPGAVKPVAVLLLNGEEVARYPIEDKELIVGRSKSCEIVIGLLGLSRRHASIRRNGDGVTIADLGSQNGTWVNNERIEGPRTLRHGDMVNFYDYTILFLEEGSERKIAVDAVQPLASFANSDVAKRRPTSKSPVPIPDSAPPRGPRGDTGLGEGSFLGDEFASADQAGSIDGSSAGPLDISASELDDLGDLDADFRVGQPTDGDRGVGPSSSVLPAGRWPGDEELAEVLGQTDGEISVTLEVLLNGKAYTRVRIAQTITRVGVDPRCELSLPRGSGIEPWHLSLLVMGGALVCMRASRAAQLDKDGVPVDKAILRDGDMVTLGRVQLRVAIR